MQTNLKNQTEVPKSAQMIDTYFPNVDGVVRTVHNYAKWLNRKSASSVICPQQKGQDDSAFSYPIFRIRSIPTPIPEYRLPLAYHAKSVIRGLAKDGVKILHVHSPFLLGTQSIRTAKKNGMKVITTFHSKYYDDVIQITKSRLLAKFVVRRIVRFYNKCDDVWACSNGTAVTLASYGYKGHITVMDNGTDYVRPENADAIRAAGREKYGLPNGVPTLLFVGHQIWQKNLKLILDTAKELENRGFDFRLLVVGSGYAHDEIVAYADKLGFAPGKVSIFNRTFEKEELMEVELASDLFFFPSLYDNAPLVLREASAMKLPALLLRGSNAAEPTTDGYNAFHCQNDKAETADKIIEIFSDREKYRDVAENARKTLGTSWDEILPKAVERYRRLLEKE